jgi:signal transduction histidine kinase
MDEEESESIKVSPFISIVSHDLRTPLSAIHLSAALIIQDAPSGHRGQRIRHRVEVIQRQVSSMVRMINTLLDAEKISAGELPINKTEVDAAEDILEVLDEFMSIATFADVLLDAKIPERPCKAHYDKDRIRQVLSNLVSNALKFAIKGSVCTLLVKNDDDPAYVRFEVSNLGPRIPKSKREIIFEKFQRGNNKQDDNISSGLGLWIARWIVEAHGGKIWVEPIKHGNVFCFTVPKN